MPAPAADQLGLGQGGFAVRAVEEVVTALDPDVRAQPVEDPFRGQLVERDDRVDAVERGDETGPVRLPYHRPGRSLQLPHAAVGVEADDQAVTKLPGGAQGG